MNGNRLLALLALEIWWALLTRGYGWLPSYVFSEAAWHRSVMISSALLAMPFVSHVVFTKRAERLWISFFMFLSSFWLIALLIGKFRFGAFGYEWLDTLILLLPFSMMATPRRGFFAKWLEVHLIITGVYLACIVVLNVLTGFHPPAFRPVVTNAVWQGIHLSFPTILLLSTLMVMRRLKDGSRWWFLLFLLLAISIGFEGHRSLAFGLIAAMLYKLFPLTFIFNRFSMNRFAGVITVLAVISAGALVYDAIKGSDESLIARQQIDSDRWELLKENWVLGVGLPSSKSELVQQFEGQSTTRFDQRILTVDSGYLDIFLRWGVPVGVLFVLSIAWLLFSSIRRLGLDPRASLTIPILFAFVVMNFTWSVLTWEHGLLVLTAALVLDASRSQEMKRQCAY